MRVKNLLIAALAIGLGGVGVAKADFSDADIIAGERLANTCLGCHAVEGLRNAYPSYRVPKIGGQSAEYLYNSLRAYRDGSRSHRTMQAQARHLSDEEMRNISAFFAQER
ncbi:cytochrome c553 [Natronocella acetinitrilica]|uniref:Cytochrome c553 n=1 Tax=Natronocella acetinitrilica TaxID=414046 RepID=A0AAE3G373_9GAMM|nr:cytochrome c [Natronocella acetinitrilica]MCP1674971.1 cytochrome c553 [Natronocella acetinitrilica]